MGAKLTALASMTRDVTAELEQRAGDLTDRLLAVRAAGHDAFTKQGDMLTEMERSVAAAEDAINQLTNGGPPLA